MPAEGDTDIVKGRGGIGIGGAEKSLVFDIAVAIMARPDSGAGGGIVSPGGAVRSFKDPGGIIIIGGNLKFHRGTVRRDGRPGYIPEIGCITGIVSGGYEVAGAEI